MEGYNFRIVNADTLNKRSYVSFYLDGKRTREYCGNSLRISIYPNKATGIAEKERLLRRLKTELEKAVKAERYPVLPGEVILENKVSKSQLQTGDFSTEHLLDQALLKKQQSDLSLSYIKNLEWIVRKFKSYLTRVELKADIRKLTTKRVQDFLDTFRSSGCHYMNKRRELGAILSLISKSIDYPLLMIQNTETAKRKAKLHSIYEHDQLHRLLVFLIDTEPALYLCCLICYGCFLRPHQEIRKLKVSHIKKDCTEIHLSGAENKGGGIRIVYIPDYVRIELLKAMEGLSDNQNIFTKCTFAFNISYFHTRWQRLKKEMLDKSLIKPLQTIYSFRHSAAVNVYRKSKDLSIIQKLMGHSDMVVTLKYLRGLGEYNDERLRDFMPDL